MTGTLSLVFSIGLVELVTKQDGLVFFYMNACGTLLNG
ncbi:MAG: hypothetical protein WBN63_01610 [Eudoraea sp.]